MKKPKSSAPFVFEVYQDAGGQWRWRLWAKNGRIVADSAEGYRRESQVVRMCERLIDGLMAAPVVATKAATVPRGRNSASNG